MTQAHATTPLTVDGLEELYHRYAADLRLAREYQRELLTQRAMRPKLDDIEAELTYLLLRDVRPTAVVEIGSFHGWSTSWILRALRDNGHGQLSTFDIVDHVRRTVPEELADGRWTFVGGDVRTNLRRIPLDVGYLFLDAAHTAGFAHWYTKSLFPRLDAGTPVSVHDVFHGRRPWPVSEGRVLLSWLGGRGIVPTTASAAAAPDAYWRLMAVKRALGLTAPVHGGRRNPMVYFRMA